VRVIDDDGEQLGIMAPQQALVIAKQHHHQFVAS